MNIFKKKSLCAALAGIGALGAAGAAQAVNLNPDGLGQALIYPYYTTRNDAAGNAYNSLLSVVNTTASVKAVKVRFLEGKNSTEVLDFNLFLSPKDVWTTAVVPSTRTAGAMAITSDRSCTLPFGGAAGQNLQNGGADFVNFAYASDNAGAGLDRTTEGYVEIIEMAQFAPDSKTATNVTHSPAGGTPPGCGDQTDALALSEALPPGGGLFGGMTLVNVNSGSDYTEDAVALDNFSDTSLYSTAGSILPNLSQASPPISVVNANGFVFTSAWTAGTADPVSAVLMHDHIMNEFVLDANTNSGTDWVVTMPTKRFYVGLGTGTPATLFQRNFNKTSGACDDVNLAIFDREEGTTTTPLGFSPPPPAGAAAALCWEANVVTFNNSNVLGSANVSNVDTTGLPNPEDGWMDIGFAAATGAPASVHTLTSADTITTDIFAFFTEGAATYVGLPVVGFAVQSFANGAITVNGTATLSNYGGNFVQKGTRSISPEAGFPSATAPQAKSMRKQ
jgi:hypothetical protein